MIRYDKGHDYEDDDDHDDYDDSDNDVDDNDDDNDDNCNKQTIKIMPNTTYGTHCLCFYLYLSIPTTHPAFLRQLFCQNPTNTIYFWLCRFPRYSGSKLIPSLNNPKFTRAAFMGKGDVIWALKILDCDWTLRAHGVRYMSLFGLTLAV